VRNLKSSAPALAAVDPPPQASGEKNSAGPVNDFTTPTDSVSYGSRRVVTDTDETLIASIVRDRSEAAFRELFRRHTPRLLQFVMRVLGPAAGEAEDVVQETWMRAAPALDRFRGESAFGTWLCGIGLNASLEHLRKKSRRSELSIGEMEFHSRAPSTDDQLDLDWAIAKLPVGCRTVLVLHDVEGYTHTEIAGQLGIAEGTSKAQLFKARRTMRTLLTKQERNVNVQ
jgi:RNA polymerase sigma-70 factor (ECF subfamily)